MTDKIVYLVVNYGVEGKEKEHINFASYDEKEATEWKESASCPNYYSLVKRIVEVEKETKEVRNGLDGLKRLFLHLVQKPSPINKLKKFTSKKKL